MTSVLDGGEDARIGQKGEGGAIGEDEVDAGGGDGALRVDVLVGPWKRERVKGSMHIDPSSTRAQEVGKKRARRPALGGSMGEVLGGAEGAIEVTNEQSGYLHIQGVGQLNGGVDKFFPQSRLPMVL
jgi:hypothetical protein